ncbi:MAG TPA: hypothetical protein VK116_05340, partial [Planctomycetota bacterium]|nr:hypothetical protein [Planctomycetota bacterium]
MLTRRQRLELWIAALLCLLVGLVALWIYAILREPSPTRTAGPHRPRLPESAPVVSELPDEITPEIAPAAIPIRIFCFDGNGRPARPDRVRITVGDETASLGDQGTIDLGPRERPARAAGRFEVAEEDGSEPMAVEFEGLVTGAGRSSGPVIDPRTGTMLEPLVVPAAPRRLVWSFVLPVEEEAPADRFSISIDTVLVEEWLGGARVWVDGSSTLPDGASIDTN